MEFAADDLNLSVFVLVIPTKMTGPDEVITVFRFANLLDFRKFFLRHILGIFEAVTRVLDLSESYVCGPKDFNEKNTKDQPILAYHLCQFSETVTTSRIKYRHLQSYQAYFTKF